MNTFIFILIQNILDGPSLFFFVIFLTSSQSRCSIIKLLILLVGYGHNSIKYQLMIFITKNIIISKEKEKHLYCIKSILAAKPFYLRPSITNKIILNLVLLKLEQKRPMVAKLFGLMNKYMCKK